MHTSGGYISGKIKVAMTLRLLAGGDAIDFGAIFGISFNWCLIIFYEFFKNEQ